MVSCHLKLTMNVLFPPHKTLPLRISLFMVFLWINGLASPPSPDISHRMGSTSLGAHSLQQSAEMGAGRESPEADLHTWHLRVL